MEISELKLPRGVRSRRLQDGPQLAEALAIAVAAVLRTAIAARGEATLVVSGGRSPIAFFEALSEQALEWSRVWVSLADERWVPIAHADSNAGLVQRHLLRGAAAQARFIGLYRSAESLEEAASLADQALAELPLPIDALVLGMGEDGHTASLFAHSPQLAQALRHDCPYRCLPMQAPGAPQQRLSMTVPLLATARWSFLPLQGSAKLETLQHAIAGEDALQMPIRALLHSPLQVYWCP